MPATRGRLFVDCSASYWRPHNQTGIQRFVREICRRAISCGPPGADCTPVQWALFSWRKADQGALYRAFKWARFRVKGIQRAKVRILLAAHAGERWRSALVPLIAIAYLSARIAAEFLGFFAAISSPRIKVRPGDTLILPEFPYRNRRAIAAAKKSGVSIAAVIHDLHPFTHPHIVGEREKMCGWLRWVVEHADKILCVSAFVAGEVGRVFEQRKAGIVFFHHGADFSSSPSGVNLDISSPYFLMVGSLAPNKRHADALDAFEILWSQGMQVTLVIVGRLGWLTDDLTARLSSHPELGRRLRWMDDASDEELSAAYRGAHALIAASEVEGFGLPVVEALLRGAPVIASDIPVFREVGGDWCEYFEVKSASSLAAAVRKAALVPRRDVSAFRWHSWDDAARRVFQLAVAP